MRRACAVLASWLLVAGCSKVLPQLGDGEPAASSSAAVPGPPVFIENDYARAREEALRRGVPLVVLGWSPWCTDCLGLRAYVLSDPALSCIATRFVWLALDADHDQTRDFWARFPIETTPTLLVLDPDRQRPVVTRVGPFTASELQAQLADAEFLAKPRNPPLLASGSASASAWRPPPLCPGAASASASGSASASAAPRASASGSASSAAAAASSAPPPRSPEQEAEREAQRRLSEAEEAEASANLAAAERSYQQAVLGPRRWSRRARAVEGLQRLVARRDQRRCVELGERELPALPAGTFAASVARTTLRCARRLEERGRPEAAHAALTLEGLALDSAQPLLPSQRSNMFEDLVQFYKATGDEERSLRLARQWEGFLEMEAALARTPAQRAVFDEHRQRAHHELGAPATALPFLEKTVEESPDDYVAQARLARTLLELKRHREALALADRALPLARGQGRLRLHLLRASILLETGQHDEARETLRQGVVLAETQPPSVDHDRVLRELRRKLAELTGR